LALLAFFGLSVWSIMYPYTARVFGFIGIMYLVFAINRRMVNYLNKKFPVETTLEKHRDEVRKVFEQYIS